MAVTVAGISGGVPYETLSLKLAANEIRAISKTCNYASILTQTGATAISFNGSSFFPLPPGIAISDFTVDELWIQDTSGAINTILIATGTATLKDNRLVIDATNPLPVTLAGNQAVNVAQVGGAATSNAGVAGTQAVGGTDAHSAPSTTNPLRIAGRVKTANDTTLVAGDACDASMTSDGALVTKPYCVPELDWRYVPFAAGIVNSAAGVTVKAATAGGLRNYVTGLKISADPLGAATDFIIQDGASSGIVMLRLKINTSGMPMTDLTFLTPLRGSSALVEIQTVTASITGSVYANLQGFVAP